MTSRQNERRIFNWLCLEGINLSIEELLVYQIKIFANKVLDLGMWWIIKMLLKEKIDKKRLSCLMLIWLECLVD
jgi:hypothetical protein